METMRLNEEQFLNALRNVKCCQFVDVITNTEPTMNKTKVDENGNKVKNPYVGRVRKISKVNAQFNYDYETAVNNRLEKQGEERNFKSEKPKWWKWENNTDLFRKVMTNIKDGTHYLRLYVLNTAKPTNQYLLDGQPMSKEDVAEMMTFVTKKSDSKKQANAGLVDNQVKPFCPKFENVVSIKIDNKIITLDM